jgi:large subunit ribosomal protein L19
MGKKVHPPMRSYPPPPSTRKRCVDPIAAVQAAQIAILDSTGARTRLFAKDNPEAAKVGDILLVRIKNGEPYAGVCLNIRRRGVDTAILLRNQLTRVGVEMWYKIYSPKVTGIEVVQRRDKRARRAKLYYMRYDIYMIGIYWGVTNTIDRKPKHDMGSVDNIVRQYTRQRAMLGSSKAQGRDPNAHTKKKGKKGKR